VNPAINGWAIVSRRKTKEQDGSRHPVPFIAASAHFFRAFAVFLPPHRFTR
jgi:hypothetical protein